jgi:hypothetical protein
MKMTKRRARIICIICVHIHHNAHCETFIMTGGTVGKKNLKKNSRNALAYFRVRYTMRRLARFVSIGTGTTTFFRRHTHTRTANYQNIRSIMRHDTGTGDGRVVEERKKVLSIVRVQVDGCRLTRVYNTKPSVTRVFRSTKNGENVRVSSTRSVCCYDILITISCLPLATHSSSCRAHVFLCYRATTPKIRAHAHLLAHKPSGYIKHECTHSVAYIQFT